MTTVVGVFRDKESAGQAVLDLTQSGLTNFNLLAPGSLNKAETEPTSESEQPGMGAAVGGVLGGALGIAGGFQLGTAVVAAIVPGVGQVVALGIGAAALLGAAGAVGGAKVGGAIEEENTPGLPADELFVYKDALRKGRSVLFVHTEDSEQADRARTILETAGAESVDAARHEWWIGLRSSEQEHYPTKP